MHHATRFETTLPCDEIENESEIFQIHEPESNNVATDTPNLYSSQLSIRAQGRELLANVCRRELLANVRRILLTSAQNNLLERFGMTRNDSGRAGRETANTHSPELPSLSD